jgi:hypothetical protein
LEVVEGEHECGRSRHLEVFNSDFDDFMEFVEVSDNAIRFLEPSGDWDLRESS